MTDKRVTQAPVEIAYRPAIRNLRVTQVVVEVIYREGAAPPAGGQRFSAQVIG